MKLYLFRPFSPSLWRSPVFAIPGLIFMGLAMAWSSVFRQELPLRSMAELKRSIVMDGSFYCGDRNQRSIFMSSARAKVDQYFSIPADSWGDADQRVPFSIWRTQWQPWENLHDLGKQ